MSDGHAAVDDVEHVHRSPLLSLGRMDGRQDQVVLVQVRRARLRRWWPRADRASVRPGRPRGSDSPGQPRQLFQVGLGARRASSCSRCSCGRYHAAHAPAPAGQGACCITCRQSRRPCQRSAAPGGGLKPAAPRPDRRPAPAPRPAGARWPAPCPAPAARRGSPPSGRAGSAPAQQRQQVLDVRGLQELQAAELHERDVAPRQLQLERGAVVRGAEQHRLPLQRQPAFALQQHLVGHPAGLLGFVGQLTSCGVLPSTPVAPQRLGKALAGLRDHGVGGLAGSAGVER